MSFSRNCDTQNDLAIWNKVSFPIFVMFETIRANISVVSMACVHDVNFGYIVIARVLCRCMLGPLRIVRETHILSVQLRTELAYCLLLALVTITKCFVLKTLLVSAPTLSLERFVLQSHGCVE